MTNHLATRTKVQEPSERGRQLFDEAPVAYHEIDRDGVIHEVNQAECLLLGYTPEQMIGQPVWTFVAAEHQQTSREAIARKIARDQPLSIVTREYRRADGSYTWLEIHEKLIETADGEVIGIRSALLDVTERLKLEEEVRKQRDWIRFVFRSVTQAAITTDALGNIILINPAAEALTGWTQEEAFGRSLEQICLVKKVCGEPVDLMSSILAEPVTSNRHRDFVIVDRTGASHPVHWSLSPIFNDDHVIVGALLEVDSVWSRD
jgi:PAS domain S-box-containing protein